jgi:hypothetical protein
MVSDVEVEGTVTKDFEEDVALKVASISLCVIGVSEFKKLKAWASLCENVLGMGVTGGVFLATTESLSKGLNPLPFFLPKESTRWSTSPSDMSLLLSGLNE